MQCTTFTDEVLLLVLSLGKTALLRWSYTHQLIYALGKPLPPPHDLFPQDAPIVIAGCRLNW